MQYRCISKEALSNTWRYQKRFAIVFSLCFSLTLLALINLIIHIEYRFVVEIIILLGLLFTMLLAIAIGFLNGWSIEADAIYVNLTGIKTKMKISSLEIAMIDDSREWYPSRCTGGSKVPYFLETGTYILKNNVCALLIQHLIYKKFVVIKHGTMYYLIGHPGVEKLYAELVRLGAMDTKFDSEVKP